MTLLASFSIHMCPKFFTNYQCLKCMSLVYAPHVPFWKGQVCRNSQFETKIINQTWGRNAPIQIIKILFFSKIRNSTPKFEKKSRLCLGMMANLTSPAMYIHGIHCIVSSLLSLLSVLSVLIVSKSQ